MVATTEWKRGGGHTHQPHSIGTEDKSPTPNFRVLFGNEKGPPGSGTVSKMFASS